MGERRYSFGAFVLHPGRELLRDGKAVGVGQRALQLLELMIASEGAVVTKADILEKVWPGVIVEEGNITVQIAALRKELGARADGQEWIATVPRVGYRWVRDITPKVDDQPSDDGRPTLAVLPFVNLSSDSSQDYFADGVVEDLIAGLSRFKSFAVISRNSAFVYKGRAVDVRQVARELGVRYVLEGSVRLAGDKVRVTTQLVDAGTGAHHWASSFDGDFSQIFAFQDRIIESVIGLVEPQIRRAEIERSRRKWPDNPRAYDHFLRALPHFYSNDPAGYVAAREHLDQAIALEGDYATALAFASWSYPRRGTVTLEAIGAEESARCLALARSALRFGGDDPTVLAICGHSLITVGGMKAEGLATVRTALAANPNQIVVLMLSGTCNILVGDLDEAEGCYKRAHRISPAGMEAFEILGGMGCVRLFKGDYIGAVEWLEQARATLVDWPPIYWWLITAYRQLGRMDEARSMLDRLLKIAPYTTLAGFRNIASRSDGRLELVHEGLEASGLR